SLGTEVDGLQRLLTTGVGGMSCRRTRCGVPFVDPCRAAGRGRAWFQGPRPAVPGARSAILSWCHLHRAPRRIVPRQATTDPGQTVSSSAVELEISESATA